MTKKGTTLFFTRKYQPLTKFLLSIGVLVGFCTQVQAQLKNPTRTTEKLTPSVVITPLPENKSAVEKTRTSDIDRVIAVVNREVITEQELKTRIAIVNRQFVEAKRPLPSPDALLKEVFEVLIDESIIFQEATNAGFKVSNQEIESLLVSISGQRNLSLEQFKQLTEKNGVRWETFRKNVSRDVVINRYRERTVESKIKITDIDIESFITTKIQGSQGVVSQGANEPETIAIAQILIPIPTGASESDVAALKVRAQGIYQQVAQEQEFLRFANQLVSQDRSLRVQDLGYRTLDRIPQIFADATNGLSAGQLASQVIQTAAGFHVLKVLDRKSSSATAGTQAKQTDSIFISQSEVNQILIILRQGLSEQDIIRKLKILREQILSKTTNFKEVAKKHSEDPNVDKNEGYLGWTSPGQLPPEIDITLGRLSPGEISEPFQTEFGWHIVQLLNRRQSEVTLSQQKEYARATLRQMKLGQANEDWLRELRDNSTIELRPPYTMTK